MIRIAFILSLIACALVITMLLNTNADTAIPFTFIGHGALGGAIALSALSAWRRRGTWTWQDRAAPLPARAR